MEDFCIHGNYISKNYCQFCALDRRKRAGRLTIEYYIQDQEYRRIMKSKGLSF